MTVTISQRAAGGFASREAAAEARARNTRTLSDRPVERRNADASRGGDSGNWPRVASRAALSLRAPEEGAGLAFEGIASATESPYEMWDWWGPYSEVIAAGAFEKTLARADLDVPLVLAHDQMRRIARTTSTARPLLLAETTAGLHVSAPDLNPDDVDVRYMAPKFADGLYDEMSFAFRIISGLWSPDYTEFRITEVDIHRGDVAIVGYGANPYTSGSLRDQLAEASDDEARACLVSLTRRFREQELLMEMLPV